MTATYRLTADQVSAQLLDSIRATFGDKEIELVVHTLDETDHLLSTKANREHLANAIKRSSDIGGRITIDLKELN